MSVVDFVSAGSFTAQGDETVAGVVIPDNSFIICQMSERGQFPDGVSWGATSISGRRATTIHSVQNTRYRLHYDFIPIGGTEDLVFDAASGVAYIIGTYAIWTNVSQESSFRDEFKDGYAIDGSDFPTVEEYAQGATIICTGGRNDQDFTINNAVNVASQNSENGRGWLEMGVVYPDTMQTSTAYFSAGSSERDGAIITLLPLHVGGTPIMF